MVTRTSPLVQTLGPGVATAIRELIEAGVYGPGAVLRQEEIASRLGVSRIPLREAFRVLEADGLITIQANRGAVVRQHSVAEVSELFDIRLMLETDLIRRACEHVTGREIERIRRIDDALSSAETPLEWVHLDEAFHHEMHALAGRPATLGFVDTLRRSLNAYYVRYLGPHVRAAEWHDEHGDLLQALAARDASTCITILTRHLRETESILLAGLNERV